MKYVASALLVLLAGVTMAAEGPQWVQKPELKFDTQAQRWLITFELDSSSDVEVALVTGDPPQVVRHLAAGVLGPKAPPPLVADSLAQRIEWDGRDDYGQPIDRASPLALRVRVGMSVALEQIVGGDPYAYYSDEMSDGDHSPWGINGLEAKSDGKVYVWGHSSNLGPPALRQYDVEGNYLQTLFPLPAGKDPAAMQGWGINLRPDGSYTPKFSRLTDPSLTTTFLDDNLRMARLLPTSDPRRLTFWRTGFQADCFQTMTMNTDGTIATDATQPSPRTLVSEPPFDLGPVEPGSHIVHSVLGPVFVAFAPDGKSFYLSGLFSATTRYGSIQQLTLDGYWRDGQVWKVDTATGKAEVFFALDPNTIPVSRQDRAAAYSGGNGYAALHGVAVDNQGHVFLADRLNQRLLVLDQQARIVRELQVPHADAIALSNKTGALYVTTRHGDFHRRGAVQLLKFNDWKKEDAPSETLEVSPTGFNRMQSHSYVTVCDTDRGSNVWVAHTQMPVRVYQDHGSGLRLLKDFFRVDHAQRCLGFDRMQVDPRTEEVYLLDAHDSVWKIADWNDPRFIKLPLETASIAIDSQRRHLYARTLRDESSSNSVGKIARYHLDQDDYPPANFAQTTTNRATGTMRYEWCFEGNSDKGLAVAPNGNLAVVGMPDDGLRVFAGPENEVPWPGVKIANLPNHAGGVRFDLAGNLYVGYVDTKPSAPPAGFEQDRHVSGIGRIHKYAPTGSLAGGNLFPTAPAEPTQTYDVLYGAFETNCVTRSPRFGLDGYGRIYYPTNIVPRVTVIDNAGNEILHFGTYGNRDSKGGLAGDLVPTNDIPLAFPNSVDATDNYLYVADMVNLRVLRLKKHFKTVAMARAE